MRKRKVHHLVKEFYNTGFADISCMRMAVSKYRDYEWSRYQKSVTCERCLVAMVKNKVWWKQ